MKNPFLFGQIVKNSDFCFRPEVEVVQNSLLQNKSVYLVGRHKMGKTSLVNNLKLDNKFVVSIDFKKCHKKQDLLQEIVSSLLASEQSLQATPDFQKLFVKYSNYNPTISMNSKQQMEFSIKPSNDLNLDKVFELVQNIETKQPVLFLDNLQEAYKINKELASQIVEAAKKHISIFCETVDIFDGSLKFDQLISKNTYVEISPLSEKDYLKFVQEKLSDKNLTISEELFSKSLEEVGVLTADRQMFFKNLFEKSDAQINESLIEDTLKYIVDQYSELYEVILEDLTDNQKNTLIKLAFNPDIKVYSKQFCEELDIQNTNTVVKILQSLIKKKLLFKDGSSHMVFSPFFKKWITLTQTKTS